MASLEVQHFVCLGLFKLTLLTLTDTSSRRMNCHITSRLQTFCGAMVGNAIGMLDHLKCKITRWRFSEQQESCNKDNDLLPNSDHYLCYLQLAGVRLAAQTHTP